MRYEAPSIEALIAESEEVMADVVAKSGETDETVDIDDLLGNLFG